MAAIIGDAARRTGTERATPQWLRSAGRHRSKYTPTTGAWVARALDVRTESHSCCWECSASTSRPARPSAGSAGSEWQPIASPRTSPKNIRVLAGSTCRRRSCGGTQPSKSDRRSRRRQAASGRANGDLPDYQVGPPNQSASASGHGGSITVTTSAECALTIRSSCCHMHDQTGGVACAELVSKGRRPPRKPARRRRRQHNL